jgi:hypothetical protein
VAQVRSSTFGLPNQELVALIMAKLALPPAIATPICEHAQSCARGGGTRGVVSPLAQALRLADLYAHGLLLASSPHAPVAPIGQPECRAAIGRAAPDPLDGTTLRCDVLANTSLFARLSRRDEAKLAQPLYPSRSLKLWYARHPSFSAFDPLEAALSQIGAASTRDRLPRGADELGGCDALVVAAPRSNLRGFMPEDVRAVTRDGVQRPLPTLYLVGAEDDAAGVRESGLESATYPIALSALATFLEAAEAARDGSQPMARSAA